LIHREIELVKMTHDEALSYVPPAGIDVNFLEWRDEKGKTIEDRKQIPFARQVVMEFLCSDLQVDPVLRKGIKDIHHELLASDHFRNRVLSRNLGSHPKSSRRGMMVEINTSNPMIREAPREVKRAIEEGTDEHDVLYSKEEIENAVVESSYRFVEGGMPRIGDGGQGHYTRKLKFPEPEPGNVIQERFYRQVGPEQALQEEYGPEKYRYKMVVCDIG
jgi:hypothetical protein